MAAEFPQKMVNLKGSDNPPITVEEAVAKQYPVIKNLIESANFNNNSDLPINLPGDISNAILSKLMMEYCKKHAESPGLGLKNELTSQVSSAAKASLNAACSSCWETMAAYDTTTALNEKVDRLKDIAASLEQAGKVFRRLSESASIVAAQSFGEDQLLNEWDANFVKYMDVGTLTDVISAVECLGIESLRVLAIKTLGICSMLSTIALAAHLLDCKLEHFDLCCFQIRLKTRAGISST